MMRLKKDIFLKIIGERKGIKEGLLIMKSKDNSERKIRLAVFIPKKFCKKAVWRNKTKRRIKEIVRKNEERMEKGKDIVFIGLAGIEKKNFWEIKKMVEKLLLKGKILR